MKSGNNFTCILSKIKLFDFRQNAYMINNYYYSLILLITIWLPILISNKSLQTLTGMDVNTIYMYNVLHDQSMWRTE